MSSTSVQMIQSLSLCGAKLTQNGCMAARSLDGAATRGKLTVGSASRSAAACSFGGIGMAGTEGLMMFRALRRRLS